MRAESVLILKIIDLSALNWGYAYRVARFDRLARIDQKLMQKDERYRQFLWFYQHALVEKEQI